MFAKISSKVDARSIERTCWQGCRNSAMKLVYVVKRCFFQATSVKRSIVDSYDHVQKRETVILGDLVVRHP